MTPETATVIPEGKGGIHDKVKSRLSGSGITKTHKKP